MIKYVSPTGNDSNDGNSLTTPWKSLNYAFNKIVAGDVLYMRGGTYRTTFTTSANRHISIANKSGTRDNPITILPYNNEVPVLDLSNIGNSTASYCYILDIANCNYLNIRGLTITKALQNKNGSPIWGFNIRNSSNCVFDNITVSYVGGYGFAVQSGCNTLTFKNCDSHHNIDQYPNPGNNTPYENANGFGITGSDGTDYEYNTATNITFDGCRAWNNADDGWDFFGWDGVATINNCWSFYNGYTDAFGKLGNGQGFKTGPCIKDLSKTHLRTVTNCLAIKNRGNGFDQNGSLNTTIHWLYNNVAYQNGALGFAYHGFPGVANIFRNNIMYSNGNTWTGGVIVTGAIQDHNSWNGINVTNSDFASLDMSQLVSPRKTDGSLPDISFMTLSATSKLIDKGIDVGKAFSGSAPDIGYKETGAIIVPPPVEPPVESPLQTIVITITGRDVKVAVK